MGNTVIHAVLLSVGLFLTGCVAIQPVANHSSISTSDALFCEAIDPDQVQLEIGTLPYRWSAECIPATPYDQSMPPGPVGLPEHIEIRFEPSSQDVAPSWREPISYLLPADQYSAMWEANGNGTVTADLDTLKQIIAPQPSPVPTDQIPVLPKEEIRGIVDVSTAGKYLDFGAWDGIRMVIRMAQDANPVTNQNLQYVFQGFAGKNDEVFISFFFPVSTSYLVSDSASLSQEEWDRYYENPYEYIETQNAALDTLNDSEWLPPLDTIDDVIASLEYGR